MATFTSTTFSSQPKALHAGVVSISGQYNHGATASSAGDVIFLCKIPHGATVIDLIEDHTTGATATGVSFGLAKGHPNTTASISCFIAAGAIATVNRRSVVGSAVTISVTDADTERYGILCASPATGTQTTSLIINWTLVYRTDGA
jgi:hypothetical protein